MCGEANYFHTLLLTKLYSKTVSLPVYTMDKRQSKTLLTIDERGSKNAINRVFNCQSATNGNRNSVSNDFRSTFVDSINVFDCRLSGVVTLGPRHFLDTETTIILKLCMKQG